MLPKVAHAAGPYHFSAPEQITSVPEKTAPSSLMLMPLTTAPESATRSVPDPIEVSATTPPETAVMELLPPVSRTSAYELSPAETTTPEE